MLFVLKGRGLKPIFGAIFSLHPTPYTPTPPRRWLGQVTISRKQGLRLKLKPGTRLSPNLEKCCLLLVSNESFANAEQDIETDFSSVWGNPRRRVLVLTGVKIPHSTQHRLVNNYHLPEPKIKRKANSLSVDGGTVRLRTPLGQKSEWKNYKAIKIHEQGGMAFFQNNKSLLKWINQQPLSQNINCLGDGHDGVWKIIEQIGTQHQRREILDWYHLMENLYKVGGSNQRLRQAKKYLWQGLVDEASAVFDNLKKKQARNFQNYLRKHRFRIPDYQLYQELDICIGEGSSGEVSSPACEPRSGSVESWIKQIASRVKIIGAEWNPKNVSQMLRLRCAYLNQAISLSIYA